MSFFKKAVVWLGLNEEYPTDDRAIVEPPRPERPATSPAPTRIPPSRPASAPAEPVVRREPAASRPVVSSSGFSDSSVRVIPIDDDDTSSDASSGTVRPVAAPLTTKPQLIVPASFNDAQQVADAYKDGKPVIVNMQNAERDLARRLIDFSSGLCYGLGGQMERVADQVYLLTPQDVKVADEERERFQ